MRSSLMRWRIWRVIFLFLAIFLRTEFVDAGVVTKSGSGAELSANASWDGDIVPGTNDIALWSSESLCTNLTLNNWIWISGIRITDASSDVTIKGGGSLTIDTNGIDMSKSPVNLSIGVDIALNGNQNWNINSGETLTLSEPVDRTFNVTKNGGGTLVLTASNTCLGVLTVNAGTLSISGQWHFEEGWQQIPTLQINPGATVVVASGDAENFLGECNFNAQFNVINGGTLQFATASGMAEGIDRAFTIGSNGCTFEVLNTNATVTFNYFDAPMQFTIPASVNLTLSGAGNGIMNKNISGLGGLIMNGTGTWTLAGTNTYDAPTIVNNGTLQINGSLISAAVNVASGAMLGANAPIGGNITLASNAQIQFTLSTNSVTIGGTLSLNGNTIHLVLPDQLTPGTYTLATYLAAGSSGAFNSAPVIDSGSVVPGATCRIKMHGGNVNLIVNPPPAPHLAILSVNGGADTVAGIPFPVAIQVQDANNNPLTNATDTNVVLDLSSGDGTLGGTLSGVIPAGSDFITLTRVTYNKAEPGVIITASNPGGTLLPGDSATFTTDTGAPATLTFTAGDNWTGSPGAALPPFIVTITDSVGNPVYGTSVIYTIVSGPTNAIGEKLSATNAITAIDGTASSILTLGSKPGFYTVTATLAASPTNQFTFTAIATNSPWQQIWSDEFEYNGLPDPTKWTYENGFVRNNESQYYTTNRLANACVSNGVLTITAQQEQYTPPGYDYVDASYTSASITSQNRESWQYGRIEMRAQLPVGASGIWPAFWALGTNITSVNWPACGEIDLMEYTGLNPAIIHGNVYYGTENELLAARGEIDTTAPFDNYHVYAIEWSSEKIDFFFDSTNYFTFALTNSDINSDNAYRHPLYILMNLALGGTYGGLIDNTALPQQFKIDYVRVYKKIPTWTALAPDNLWSSANNWTNDMPPTNGDGIIFTGNQDLIPCVDSSYNLGGLTFDGAAGNFILYSTNGATITLTTGGINNLGTNNQTINVPIVLAADQMFNAAYGGLTLGNSISGNGFSVIKIGASTLTFLNSNNYSGNTIINEGTLALASTASIGSSPFLSIAAGATFDVSGVGDYTFPNGTALSASGTGSIIGITAACINGGSNQLIDLLTNAITLTYDGANPTLYISQGILSLNGNAFKINTANGAALPPGVYPIIQQASSNILSAGEFPPVSGNAIAPGQTGAIVVTGNTVALIVDSTLTTPVFTNLTVLSPITYGTTNITLNGTVIAPDNLTPVIGDTVSVSVNGDIQTTSISDATGDFTINFNPSTIPASTTPYSIDYIYAGNASAYLASAQDTSTTLTVSPAPLTITPNPASKTYGQTFIFAGSEFTEEGLLGSDSVAYVGLSSAGAIASAPVASYPILASNAVGNGLTNYDINYASSRLDVEPALLLVTANNISRCYGATNPPLAAAFNGFTNGDSQSAVQGFPLLTTSATTNSPVGTYIITNNLGTLSAANYSFVLSNGILTVSPAKLGITASNLTKIYGQTLSYKGTEFFATGLENNETIGSVTLTSEGTARTDAVGTYPITPSAAVGGTFNPADYKISYTNGTLSVTAAPAPSAQSLVISNGWATITFSGVAGVTYVTQSSTDPTEGWTPISTNTPDESGIWTVTDFDTTENMKFYRTIIP